MTIKTKFNMSDEVWFMYRDKPTLGKIYGIFINITSTIPSIVYRLGIGYTVLNDTNYNDLQLFKTKSALLASL